MHACAGMGWRDESVSSQINPTALLPRCCCAGIQSVSLRCTRGPNNLYVHGVVAPLCARIWREGASFNKGPSSWQYSFLNIYIQPSAHKCTHSAAGWQKGRERRSATDREYIYIYIYIGWKGKKQSDGDTYMEIRGGTRWMYIDRENCGGNRIHVYLALCVCVCEHSPLGRS